MRTIQYLDVPERNLPRPDAQPAGGRAQVDVDLRHPHREHAHDVPRQEERRVDVDEGSQEEEAGDVNLLGGRGIVKQQ